MGPDLTHGAYLKLDGLFWIKVAPRDDFAPVIPETDDAGGSSDAGSPMDHCRKSAAVFVIFRERLVHRGAAPFQPTSGLKCLIFSRATW